MREMNRVLQQAAEAATEFSPRRKPWEKKKRSNSPGRGVRREFLVPVLTPLPGLLSEVYRNPTARAVG